MPKILITGMSGTGKSTALQILGRRGHRTVDTDTDRWNIALAEPLLRTSATVEIDASAPVEQVVHQLEELIQDEKGVVGRPAANGGAGGVARFALGGKEILGPGFCLRWWKRTISWRGNRGYYRYAAERTDHGYGCGCAVHSTAPGCHSR